MPIGIGIFATEIFNLRLKDVPVYMDLLRLPLPVIWKRVSKRLVPSSKSPKLPEFPEVKFSNRSLFAFESLKTAEFNSSKWKVIINHYLNDELNFLGSGWSSIRNEDVPRQRLYGNFPRPELGKKEPDWNRDQRSGFQFNIAGKPESELQSAFETDQVDVKYTWEFARMYHWPQLALGAHVFPELKVKCISQFERQLQSFADQCPCGSGIHWSSPMEVSIRLVNLLAAFELFSPHQLKIESQILRLAYEHWYFIKNNLENKSGYGTNHYLSNLMGLIVAGLFLENSKVQETQKWAVAELDFELSKQFHEDGVNFEYSTYYHRLSTEISIISLLAAIRSGLEVQKQSRRILRGALDVLEIIQKPNGFLPQFGDNDSGRVLDLDPAGILRTEFYPAPELSGFCTPDLYKSGVYKWVYKDLINKLPESRFTPSDERISLDYKELKFQQDWILPFSPIILEDIQRYDFKSTGLFVFRSNCFHLSINLMASKHGHRYRGHMHNDKSGFELWVNGESLMEDPGVLSYTASVEERNLYRSTAVHPVPFTGVEQNRFLRNFTGLFHMKLDVHCEVLELSRCTLIARTKYRGVEHVRSFQIFRDNLRITDYCNKRFTVSKKSLVKQTSGYGKSL